MNTKINFEVFSDFPIINTERLVCRAFSNTDAEMLLEIRSNDQVMTYMDTSPHKSILDAVNMITNIHQSFEQKEGVNWVIADKETNDMLGYIGFWRFISEHVRGEIGYALAPEFWGQGFMFEAAKAVLKFGFESIQFHSVEGNVNQMNKKSIDLLVKLGFIKEAHFRENYFYDGKYIDSIIYSLLETDFMH